MSNKTPYIHTYPSTQSSANSMDSTSVTDALVSDDFGVPTAVNVSVGTSLPSSSALQLPTLLPNAQAVAMQDSGIERQSLIAEGVNFVGNAQLSGVCSVGGHVDGNLMQSPGYNITVIVTESGYVKGDIVASNISIMGHTDGLLDATGGSVTLHDASRVSGHVRYNRLQVNGADLNATLEKAVGAASTSPSVSAALRRD